MNYKRLRIIMLIGLLMLVAACKTTMNSIQPSNNPNELILLRYAGGKERALGVERYDYIYICSWTVYGEYVESACILKFDIPGSRKIKKAVLKLFSLTELRENGGPTANTGKNNALIVQQITSDWSRSTLSWSNLPELNTSNRITVPHTPLPNTDIEIDVTDMVKSMIENTNYGFFIRLEHPVPYNSRQFCGSAYPQKNMRPLLTINY